MNGLQINRKPVGFRGSREDILPAPKMEGKRKEWRESVSYTHLDVYKRQDKEGGVLKADGREYPLVPMQHVIINRK